MAEKKEQPSVFSVLNSIDVNEHTEKKNNLTYLSWSWAWAEVKKRFPDAEYKIFRNEQNLPYFEDPNLGIMCYTSVTIEGQTYEMWLPVMDGANKAMKRSPYTYKVWNRNQGRWEEKTVAAATMFDINKTLMRCLVKNLAMFGLGLYIYSGEDLPEQQTDEQTTKPAAPAPQTAKPAAKPAVTTQQPIDFGGSLEEQFELIKANIETAPSRAYLMDLKKNNPALGDYKPFREAMNKRYKEVS